ncbi:MAG TPA: hypothetical protein VFU35_11720 [Jatrophihabitans sp.]|nr:hypothetical protein [Jatrophihabitans sp.]
MYLNKFAFTGDPATLEAGYRRVAAPFTDDIDLQLAVRHPDGLDVYDSCPTREDLVAFSTGAPFRAALAEEGLPDPEITELGEIVNTVLPERVAG